MASPVRKLEVGLAVCGLLVGFALTLAGMSAIRNAHHRAAAPATSGPAVIDSGSGDQASPSALDAEWAAYSGHSTCADWAGGDGVSAIRLSSSQIAWFFSDTYLGPAGATIGFSHVSGFVHNLLVVQTTAGSTSRFVTLTGGGACGGPGQSSRRAVPVVSDAQSVATRIHQWLWDEDGVTVGPYVLKFYNSYLPGTESFVPVGTLIAKFAVSSLEAAGHGPVYGGLARPQVTSLPAHIPPGGGTPIVWGSALLQVGATVYVYGWQSPDPRADTRQLYLARVPATRLTDFAKWQFYTGGRWLPGQQNAHPVQAAGSLSVSTGFSVVLIGGRYWLIQQAVQAGSPDIDAYPAPAPWGPFDPAGGVLVYRSPDIGLDQAHDYRIMYEARVEPAVSTPQNLIISYNVNSEAVTTGCVPMSVYTNTIIQPRFITVPRAAFSAVHAGPVGGLRVVAGSSPYPSIARKNPTQWFDGWAYKGGCPPVPAVLNVAIQQDKGTLLLEWPNMGLGLRYEVYVRRLGDPPSTLARTVSSPGATLSGLSRGATYQIRVVAIDFKRHTGPATVATVVVH
jgi:hypothetical protein